MLLHFKGQLMFDVGRCVRRGVSTQFIYLFILVYLYVVYLLGTPNEV